MTSLRILNSAQSRSLITALVSIRFGFKHLSLLGPHHKYKDSLFKDEKVFGLKTFYPFFCLFRALPVSMIYNWYAENKFLEQNKFTSYTVFNIDILIRVWYKKEL